MTNTVVKNTAMANKGFSLIEAIIAVAILGILMAGVIPGFMSNLQTNDQNERRSEAVNLAQQTLETLRRTDMSSLPMQGSSSAETAQNSRTYTVVTSYCKVASYCAQNSARHLTVEIRYQGKKVYEVETVYTNLR